MPKVSVILPVYNCEQYILESVQSVLNQSFFDFELLIIDDCSTDNTLAIINEFKDSRIKLILKEKNTGYTDSLNYAISIAKGQYIARMDGDDICLPNRFEKQVAFLDENPKIILCGSAIQIIGTSTILRHPTIYEDIKIKLCFGNSFYHPSVMGRIEVFQANPYDKTYEPAEDYDLWTRIAFQGELANLEEVLLWYRVHENQVSTAKSEYQTTVGYASQYRMFKPLNLNYDESIYKIMHKTFKLQEQYITLDFENSLLFLDALLKANYELQVYDKTLFYHKIQSIKLNFLRVYFKRGDINVFKMFMYLRYISFKEISKLIFKKK
jgi:glycosyltransferase involved in cell wall biosynthesis